MKVDFKPMENFLNKEEYKGQTVEFKIEDFYKKEDNEGKINYRLILTNTQNPKGKEDLRSNNSINFGLQERFGPDSDQWKGQIIKLSFSDWLNDKGEVAGIKAELV